MRRERGLGIVNDAVVATSWVVVKMMVLRKTPREVGSVDASRYTQSPSA